MKAAAPIFLTLAQASERSGVSIAELNRARIRGDLPGRHQPGYLVRGRAMRIRADALAAYISGLPAGPDRGEALRFREHTKRSTLRVSNVPNGGEDAR